LIGEGQAVLDGLYANADEDSGGDREGSDSSFEAPIGSSSKKTGAKLGWKKDRTSHGSGSRDPSPGHHFDIRTASSGPGHGGETPEAIVS
jgi:hypothetical protein